MFDFATDCCVNTFGFAQVVTSLGPVWNTGPMIAVRGVKPKNIKLLAILRFRQIIRKLIGNCDGAHVFTICMHVGIPLHSQTMGNQTGCYSLCW